MSGVVVELTAKMSEEACNIDVLVLHDTLMKMPMETYLALYKIMTVQIAQACTPLSNFLKE